MSALFISYASGDQSVAQEVCAGLEAHGVPCWIAPRDVAAGKVWDEAILDAIEGASAFLLILSSHANGSQFVKNEVNRAFSLNKPIVTFRVEDVTPGRSLELYLARHHWTDGFPAPIDDKLARLAEAVTRLLVQSGAGASAGAIAGAADHGQSAMAVHAHAVVRPSTPSIAARVIGRLRRVTRSAGVAWAVAGAALAALAALGLALTTTARPQVAFPVLRTSIPLAPDSTAANFAPSLRFALSPDGRRLAYVALNAAGQQLLWLRPLDVASAQPVAGSEGAIAPFWSPDGRSVAFFVNGTNKLKRVDAAGGSVSTICDVPPGGAAGGTWNQDGVILLGSAGSGNGIFSVAASGGTPVSLQKPDPKSGEVNFTYPWFLQDGRHYLYARRRANGLSTHLASLDGSVDRRLLAAGSNAQYAGGHLLLVRDNMLIAQPFDTVRLEIAGEPVVLSDSLLTGGTSGAGGAFSVSQSGLIVYVRGENVGFAQLTWMDRAGVPVGSLGDPANYADVELSPDGARVAVSISSGDADLWLHEIGRNLRTRFTFDRAVERAPSWSPDGSRILFDSSRSGSARLYQKGSNGAGSEEELVGAPPASRAYGGWSPDDRTLVFQAPKPDGSHTALWTLSRGSEQKAVPFLQAPGAATTRARVSPDGRWVAYQSSETGRSEVYVTTFPKPSGKWQVSGAGGEFPRWRRDGKEIFYLAPGGRLMAAAVNGAGDAFHIGETTPLFETRLPTNLGYLYDVSADGRRVLVAVPVAQQGATPMTLLTNWPALLKKP